MVSLGLMGSMLVYSCKDEPIEKEPCSNGFKDKGEEKIDCGGICPPCPSTYTPLFLVDANLFTVQLNNPSIGQSQSKYILGGANDSISVQIGLGSSPPSLGTYPITEVNSTFVQFKNGHYVFTGDGTFAYQSVDNQAKRASGFVEATFVHSTLGDTLQLDGQFNDLVYP